MNEPRTQTVGPVDLLAFLCEVAMLVLLVVAALGIGSTTVLRLVLAVAFVAVAVAIWSTWMAPTSSRRLPARPRLAVQSVLFVATAALVAAAGHPWWGVGFAVVAIGAFAATGGA